MGDGDIPWRIVFDNQTSRDVNLMFEPICEQVEVPRSHRYNVAVDVHVGTGERPSFDITLTEGPDGSLTLVVWAWDWNDALTSTKPQAIDRYGRLIEEQGE